MIEIDHLTKRYGTTTAVDDLSFTVRPGEVTGFLGPNGAGKSTTMRLVLGLQEPTSGTALVNGRPYREAARPSAELGALLDAKAVDKARSARGHLLALGATVGVGARRVDEVLGTVGLAEVAHHRAGSFSLGMAQRLGIASALLADPAVVMLDEPVNGLDLDGITWIRSLLTGLAAEGRTVLLSSHLMTEMQLVATHLVVIGRGRILADTSMADFLAGASTGTVHVSTPDAARLSDELCRAGATVSSTELGSLDVKGLSAPEIGALAAEHRVVLHALTPEVASLEAAYTRLTEHAVQFTGSGTADPSRTTAPTTAKAA